MLVCACVSGLLHVINSTKYEANLVAIPTTSFTGEFSRAVALFVRVAPLLLLTIPIWGGESTVII